MKRTLILLAACAILAGCGDNKKQEKALLDSVIKIHDHMMGNDEMLMRNKMKIDTLLKDPATAGNAEAQRQLMGLKVELTNAEDGMEKWMQKFNPDQTGKSHDEVMNYLQAQKAQIINVNASIDSAINASTNYLKTLNK